MNWTVGQMCSSTYFTEVGTWYGNNKVRWHDLCRCKCRTSPNQCVIYIQWTDLTVQVPSWKLDRTYFLPILWRILSFCGVQTFITVFTHVATGIYSGPSNPLPTLQEHPRWFCIPHGLLFIVNGSFLPRGLFCQGMKLTNRLHLVPMLRMLGVRTPLHHMPYWRTKGLLWLLPLVL
jgi:hypothetical protein